MSRSPAKTVLVCAGLLVALLAPTAAAEGEPGVEYIFIIDESNSSLGLEMANYWQGSALSGWFSLYLEDPVPGNPTNYDGKCVLGDCEFSNVDDYNFIFLPTIFEVRIFADNFHVHDFDIWYQDPNEWNLDISMWPDPNHATDANDAPDPNDVVRGDPNDPNYNDPNDPNVLRWANLTGGPGTSSGELNSEFLFYTQLELTFPNDVVSGAAMLWSTPFDPWSVEVSDTGNPDAPTQATLNWTFHIEPDPNYGALDGTLQLEGIGGVARQLTLEVSHPENGTVQIDPEMPRDRYPHGLPITLTAVPDPNGKGFNKWEVVDPADSNNNYSDTNLVLTLTMDRDWEVKAKFACGSAALMPMIGLTLLGLAGIVAYRRRT